MKLYFAPGTCSLAPQIVLHELGIPFEPVAVNNKTKKTASGDDFLAINPKGYVAALELDDGQILTEGPAIVQYVADLRPEAGLAPPPGTRRVQPPSSGAPPWRWPASATGPACCMTAP